MLFRSQLLGLTREITDDSTGKVRKVSLQEKSVQKILQGIQSSLEVPFERVLYAIGIRYVGETVAKKLAKHFGSMDNIMKASREQLMEAEEIGEKIADSMLRFFEVQENKQLIGALTKAGLQMELTGGKNEPMSSKLAGMTFVVSGVFEHYGRDEIKAVIEQNGGKVSGSVSAKTTFLLAGEEAGPSKLEKAEKLKVKMLSEKDFIKMIAD